MPRLSGAEPDFEFASIVRDLLMVIQGMVKLLSGAVASLLHSEASLISRQIRQEDRS